MLSGFNTNVRHKGVVFHVQTEDSGRDHPHVITHLFHGGNILASEKKSYQHLLDKGEIEVQVKRLMNEQHGAMLEKLRKGHFDGVIRERLGSGSDTSPTASARPPVPPPAPKSRPAQARPAAERKPAAAPAAAPAGAAPERQRPLDEVVLEYLLESARQRPQR